MPANAVPGGLIGDAGSFNGDDTGNFAFGIACATSGNCNGGSTPVFQQLTFTVTNSTIAQLTTTNNLGNIFVADLLIGANGLTGAVDVSTPAVPDGGMTLMLLAGALVGLEGLRRRFRL